MTWSTFVPASSVTRADIVRRVRFCHERLHRGKIQFDHLLVGSVSVGSEGRPVAFALLRFQESACDLIAREDRGRHAKFRAHVRDGRAFRDRKRFNAVAAVFDHGADISLGREHPEDGEDDVLGRDPGLKLSREVHFNDLGAGEVERPASHGNGHVQAAGADRDHADAAAGRRVRVRAQERFARPAEPFEMDLVADAVAGPRVKDAVLCGHGLEVAVVVGVLKPVLERVVVHVAHRELGFDLRNSHGLELEVGHGAGGVLRQGLVDPDRDLGARLEFSFNEMGFQYFVNDVFAHTGSTPLCAGMSRHYISRAGIRQLEISAPTDRP